MNAVLKKAKSILREISTIAVALADGKVTVVEKVKFAGTRLQVDLREFIPQKGDNQIVDFQDLSESDIAFITGGHSVPDDVLQNVYQSAKDYVEAAYLSMSYNPDVTIEVPPVLPEMGIQEVKGVGPKLAEVLISIGIKTVSVLAAQEPESLINSLKLAKVSALVLKNIPDIIQEAKKMVSPK